MLILALCSSSDQVPQDTASVPDAIIFTDEPPKQSTSHLNSLGVTWGVSLERYTTKSMKSLCDAGCDFIVLANFKVKLDLLNNDDIGRFFQIPPSFSTDQAHSIVDLPIDMVLLSDPLVPPITLQQVLDISTTRGEIGKPALLILNGLPSEWEIECLRDIGIDGLILDVRQSKPDAFASLKRRILDLPRRRSRSERTVPTVPSMDQPHASEYEEEEEEI